MAIAARIRTVGTVVATGLAWLLRVVTPLLRLGFVVTAGVLVLAVVGYAADDRLPALAGLTYVPLFPVALVAVVIAALPPAASRRARALLCASGVLAALIALTSMIGWQRPRVIEAQAGGVVRLLQWNVLGGGYRRFLHWEISEDKIMSERPDILVLSEAPRDRSLAHLLGRLGPEWSSVQVEDRPKVEYWYKLVIASRWPLHVVQEQALNSGHAMLAQVDVPGHALRVLVVDGESNPMRDRSGMLKDIAELTRAQAQAGTPIDVVAGDFNAPSRSVGFQPIWDQGYQLAAAASGAWRATFPMFLPLLDIDHVLVRAPLAFDCSLFTSRGSDHRGQLVRVRIEQAHAQAALRGPRGGGSARSTH